jgi:hypothetical protein
MAKFQTLLDNLEISQYPKISFSTKEGTPMRVQTPRLYMPFGISGFTPAVGNTKWNIDFSMKGHDEEGAVKDFYETLQKTEAAIVEEVRKQSPTIFEKEMTTEELLPMFNSNIKHSPDREPKFRVRVDTVLGGGIKAGIFDKDKNDITTELTDKLYARNSGIAIVEMANMYFLNKKFGVTWKLHQLVVYEPQQLKGFQFIL